MSSNNSNGPSQEAINGAIAYGAQEYARRYAAGDPDPDFYVTVLNSDGSNYARLRASTGQWYMWVPNSSNFSTTASSKPN